MSNKEIKFKEIKCIVVNNYQELIINVKEQYNDQEKCNNQEQFSKEQFSKEQYNDQEQFSKEQYNNQEQFSKETVSNKEIKFEEIKFEEIKFKVVNTNNQKSIINFLKSKSI